MVTHPCLIVLYLGWSKVSMIAKQRRSRLSLIAYSIPDTIGKARKRYQVILITILTNSGNEIVTHYKQRLTCI